MREISFGTDALQVCPLILPICDLHVSEESAIAWSRNRVELRKDQPH
jgi:hypothetical protein